MMNDTYQIRLAQENELYQLNTIEETASKLFENTKFALEVDQDSLSIDLLREQQARGLVWIAVDDRDNLVGFAVVMIMGDRIHLHELSVTPEHGSKGLGTRLIKTIIQYDNIDYCRFYIRSGYVRSILNTKNLGTVF